MLHHLVVLANPGHDRRLEVVAAVALAPATRGDLGVVGQPGQEPAHSLHLRCVVHRRHERVLVARTTGVRRSRAAGLPGQCREEVVVDARSREHARGRRTVLSGVEVARDRDRLRGSLEVRVVEHHDGGFAAELEVDLLQVRRGGLGDLHPRAHGAGDGDHLRRLVRHHGAAGVAVPADDVEDSGREELRRDLGEEQ